MLVTDDAFQEIMKIDLDIFIFGNVRQCSLQASIFSLLTSSIDTDIRKQKQKNISQSKKALISILIMFFPEVIEAYITRNTNTSKLIKTEAIHKKCMLRNNKFTSKARKKKLYSFTSADFSGVPFRSVNPLITYNNQKQNASQLIPVDF